VWLREARTSELSRRGMGEMLRMTLGVVARLAAGVGLEAVRAALLGPLAGPSPAELRVERRFSGPFMVCQRWEGGRRRSSATSHPLATLQKVDGRGASVSGRLDNGWGLVLGTAAKSGCGMPTRALVGGQQDVVDGAPAAHPHSLHRATARPWASW
jgi:hypothetical protein